jgi:hypothetical protein
MQDFFGSSAQKWGQHFRRPRSRVSKLDEVCN